MMMMAMIIIIIVIVIMIIVIFVMIIIHHHDIRDKNAVNQGFWSKTAVLAFLQQKCIIC